MTTNCRISTQSMIKATRLVALVSVTTFLAACVNISKIAPGTPTTQVIGQLGEPTLSCPLEDGGKRLIWSGQPLRQHAWGTNADAQGRIGSITQLLTDEHFQILKSGDWTPEKLLCEFGPPAEKTAVGLPSSLQVVWSWRYMQDGVWYSLMHVYLGRDGQKVTHFHPGPDPLYEADTRFF